MNKEAKEITIDGVTYISVKEAASLASYTTDYVGQLCREEKIDAVRIGRAWYVSEQSIISHKEDKMFGAEERPLYDSIHSTVERQKRKMTLTNAFRNDSFVLYHKDDTPLIPTLMSVERKRPIIVPKEIVEEAEQVPEIITKSIENKRVPKNPPAVRPKRLALQATRAVVATSAFAAVFLIFFSINSTYTAELVSRGSEQVATSIATSEFVDVVNEEVVGPYARAAKAFNVYVDDVVASVASLVNDELYE